MFNRTYFSFKYLFFFEILVCRLLNRRMSIIRIEKNVYQKTKHCVVILMNVIDKIYRQMSNFNVTHAILVLLALKVARN